MGFQLLDCQSGGLERRRRQHLEKRLAHRLVEGEAAHAEALDGVPSVELLTFAIVAGRGVRALISDAQSTAAVSADHQALQQCRSFSQGATCLVEFSADVGFEARLNGGKRRPVDETFMMSGKQHRPLLRREMSDSPSDRALLIDIALLASLTINVGACI